MRLCSAVIGLVVASFQAEACPKIDGNQALQSNRADALSAFFTMDPVTVSEPTVLNVTFCVTGDQAVSEIQFDAIMPAHKHGMNYRAEVIDLDGNRFQIKNVLFHMPGIWQLQIDAMTSLGRQSFTHEIRVD